MLQHLDSLPDCSELIEYPKLRTWHAFGALGLEAILAIVTHDDRRLERFSDVCGVKSLRVLLQPDRNLRYALLPQLSAFSQIECCLCTYRIIANDHSRRI